MRHWNLVRSTMLVALSALSFVGCSTFNYEWWHAAKKATPTGEITGRWEGRWLSHANGHNDKMRCLIRQVDTNRYDAKFHAAYKKWITIYFGYTVRLDAKPGTNGVAFHGQQNLGRLAGGVFTYEGYANTTNFFSTYKSKDDHGIFQMHRPSADQK